MNGLKLLKFNAICTYFYSNFNVKTYNKQDILDENGNVYFKLRIVPRDYDVNNLNKIKKFCKNIGLDFESEFIQDYERLYGYRDYHECVFIPNEDFCKNKLLERVKEIED